MNERVAGRDGSGTQRLSCGSVPQPLRVRLFAMFRIAPGSRLRSRGAMGFWFFGLGLLGLVRGSMRAFRDAAFQPDLIAWLWLAGSVVLLAAGARLLLQAWRPPSG